MIKCSFCGRELDGSEKVDAWCASCPNQICYQKECEAKHDAICTDVDKSNE